MSTTIPDPSPLGEIQPETTGGAIEGPITAVTLAAQSGGETTIGVASAEVRSLDSRYACYDRL